MPINKTKSLACFKDYTELNDQMSGLFIDKELMEELIMTQLSRDWEVSIESAKRYVREGRRFQRLDDYNAELEEQHMLRRTLEESLSIEDDLYDEMVDDFYTEYEDTESPFPILCIPDTHIPFEHRNALQFCKDIHKEFSIKSVVHLGDFVDNHALSFHTNELDAMTAEQEYQATKKRVQDWFEAFPEVKLVQGNHDKLPARRAKEWGLPRSYMKSFHQLWDAPEGWTNEFSYDIAGIRFQHAGKAGFAGAINSAILARKSLVVGHQHSYGGVLHHANEDSLIFGANGGCLIDNSAYAYRYGKEFPNKPTLGCVVVHSAVHAEYVPMTDKYFTKGEVK